MKKLSLFFASLFLLIFNSCNIDEGLSNELKDETAFNYEKFYSDYKSTISKMSREELAGLNKNLLTLSYNDFSNQKKLSLWKDKLIVSSNNKIYNSKQREFLRKLSEKLDLNFFMNLDNNLAEDLIADFFNNGFKKEDIIKITNHLNDIDQNNELENFLIINDKIATKKSMNFLNKNSSKELKKCSSIEDCYTYKTIEEYKQRKTFSSMSSGDGSKDCTSAACFWCSHLSSGCSSNCKSKSIGCGVFFVQRCEVNCSLF